MSKSSTRFGITQGKIVAGIDLVMRLVFAVTLSGFATSDNILSLLQNVAVLGILGLGRRSPSSGAGSTCRWLRLR